jgi:Tol biopolymer transport system component/DNA-binding winged helix-turn-helix (wHTH) protein
LEEISPGAQVIRFGTFEVNLRAGEIRKSGMKLKLSGQPFQVLVTLLERPGEVVTREELQKRLWPDTFVDIDHNLNAAINKIREVLGDSAESPRFVETVPRRGYRFVAPLNGGGPKGNPESTVSVAVTNEPTERRDAVSTRAGRVIALVLLAVAFAGLASWRFRSRQLLQVVASTRLTYSAQAYGSLSYFWQEFSGLGMDGNRIYFSAVKNGITSLAYVSTKGGEPEFLAGPVRGRLCHISPDGSMLLVLGKVSGDRGAHLWFVPTAGGGARRVGEIDGQDGAWSPDGRQIVYAKDQALWVARSDGSEARKLAEAGGRAHWLRWSPDGALIRFTQIDSHSNVSLWECRSDGSGVRRIPIAMEGQTLACCGEWSAGGRYFLFRVLRQNHSEVWQIREGSFQNGDLVPNRLTTGALDVAAAIPGKSERELFSMEMQPGAKAWRYDVKERRITPFLPGMDVAMASTSADGQWVAYVEVRGRQNVLWRSRYDGSDRLPLTAAMKAIVWPKWSPNGRQIAFAAEDFDKAFMTYVVDASGGTPRVVMSAEHRYVDPSWSPGGESLMVGRTPDYLGEPGEPKAIEMVNLETKQVTKLTGSDGLFSPHWSPDGRYVAASRLDQRQLLLFDFGSQTWRILFGKSPEDRVDSAQWSPDSQNIYFNNFGKVLRVSRDNGKVEEVLNLATIDPNASYCDFVDTAFDGALLGNCWSEGGDIYRLDLKVR